MIRVGRCKYNKNGQVSYPSYEGFTNVVVMMRSHSTYHSLSPYELKNDQGHIMENIWQFSKVYAKVPKTKQTYSRWNPTVIWDHPAETHFIPKEGGSAGEGQILPAYRAWRKKGVEAEHAIRYPVGYNGRHACLFSMAENDDGTWSEPLDYIQGRKRIYVPTYCDLASKESKYTELRNMLDRGKNILIIEIDGPHQESLDYYKTKYGVDDDFIQSDTMLATEENLRIMLNDPKHPFGHGYCLAMSLLGVQLD